MFMMTELCNGTTRTHDTHTRDNPGSQGLDRGLVAEGTLQGRRPLPPAPDYTVPDAARSVLALFCYEDPASVVGQFVAGTAAALAARGIAVHLFLRRAFTPEVADVTVHVLGEPAGTDLLDRVQEFTHRACNAFLQEFQATTGRVTLMGFEWSSVQALSILRGIKDLDMILSLHSLERQRGDLSSDLGKRIEEIEHTGLREAKTILVHEPATAEVAKYLVPKCVDRITSVPLKFPVERFTTNVDPGAIKGRYQVGPLDPTILFVGDLSERYGPDLLVKAMPAILKNHKQARLVLVGDGALYWPLRVFTRYLLLEHAVRLAGHVAGTALQELIQAADVVAVPSREATPWWPVLAAWAAGRPVVATHGAAPDLLKHDCDGLLCYPSENSCVWGIERMLHDPGFAGTLARNGRRKLEERFGWNAVAAQVEELMGVTPANYWLQRGQCAGWQGEAPA